MTVNFYEPIGYLASLLVLATFCMRGMVALRAVAIASNIAFIAYGWLVGIDPVLILHLVLLPTNAWRLLQAVAAERRQIGRTSDLTFDGSPMGLTHEGRRVGPTMHPRKNDGKQDRAEAKVPRSIGRECD